MSFEKFGLDPRLLKAVNELGYERPTPIQDAAIPSVMAGNDIMGSAQTGTGKTAAFGLPILQRLLDEHHKKHSVRALVLSPTRELAAQIEESLRSYACHTRQRVLAVFGGVSIVPQREKLRTGVDILVATPGRLLDHLDHHTVTLNDVEVFVLDEADRMLDMGFLPDIRRVLHYLPTKRQTMLFSATIPPEIASLARGMLKDPIEVQVGVRSSAAVGITHAIYPCAAHLKPEILPAIMKELGTRQVLIFTRTKRRADRVGKLLSKAVIRNAVLHGDRTQKQRIAALEGFKRGQFEVLVATDIAARGLDVENISHVINFDVPGTPEDYVHRIGRTARAERRGDAFTIVSPEEEMSMRAIERHLGQVLPRVALRDFNYEAPPPERQTGLQRASVNTTGPARTSFTSRRPKLRRKR
ncbi:DEAD/DEAH box helicase [candidate division KSB1 bacterium]|nr:DEAD/DEAH box helicase [candidate division KSB1 bacterium]